MSPSVTEILDNSGITGLGNYDNEGPSHTRPLFVESVNEMAEI